MPKTKPLFQIVYSDHGEFDVNFDKSGEPNIVSYIRSEGGDDLSNIVRFDTAEYKNWHAQAFPNVDIAARHNVDILDIGYFYTNDQGNLCYEEPVWQHRLTQERPIKHFGKFSDFRNPLGNSEIISKLSCILSVVMTHNSTKGQWLTLEVSPCQNYYALATRDLKTREWCHHLYYEAEEPVEFFEKHYFEHYNKIK